MLNTACVYSRSPGDVFTARQSKLVALSSAVLYWWCAHSDWRKDSCWAWVYLRVKQYFYHDGTANDREITTALVKFQYACS
mmetsp:Transcript_32710/g.101238  ORF Transcript_32710/g.101238 Transcript_32710/m.101238 type:complete len:81 (-) Transcript_32710:535-777(-)